MKTLFQVNGAFFKSFVAVAVVGLACLSSPAFAQQAYSNLLESCGNAINEAGFSDAKKKVVRKLRSGGQYKFWIEVKSSHRRDAEHHRAYCEGQGRSGEIEQFALGDGEWRNRYWTEDTSQLLSGALARQ